MWLTAILNQIHKMSALTGLARVGAVCRFIEMVFGSVPKLYQRLSSSCYFEFAGFEVQISQNFGFHYQEFKYLGNEYRGILYALILFSLKWHAQLAEEHIYHYQNLDLEWWRTADPAIMACAETLLLSGMVPRGGTLAASGIFGTAGLTHKSGF